MTAPPWYRWPSWLTEILGGIVLASLAQGLPLLSWQFVAALWVSWVYESMLDPNGWSWKDFGQRAVGIVLGLLWWRALQ